MNKILFQLSITIGLFFIVWLGLAQFNWEEIFRIEEHSNTTEEELGKLFWKMIEQSEKEIKNPKIDEILDSLINRICSNNGIDTSSIKLHLIEKDEINAFALPDHHLVVYSGLIDETENESELLGVFAHEIAHMEENHIMKKLIKEIGLSVLISLAGGDANGTLLKQAMKSLSSTAFDREMEKEADKVAVDYLVNSDIDPEGLAEFLYKLLDKEPEIARQMSWFSTHPEIMDRVNYILDYSKSFDGKKKSVLHHSTWTNFHELVTDEY